MTDSCLTNMRLQSSQLWDVTTLIIESLVTANTAQLFQICFVQTKKTKSVDFHAQIFWESVPRTKQS